MPLIEILSYSGHYRSGHAISRQSYFQKIQNNRIQIKFGSQLRLMQYLTATGTIILILHLRMYVHNYIDYVLNIHTAY